MNHISHILDQLPRDALPDLIEQAARRLQPPVPPVREFLSITQLCARVPLSEQSIRNLMALGRLEEGREFVRRGRRVIFDWQAMVEWLKRPAEPAAAPFEKIARRRT